MHLRFDMDMPHLWRTDIRFRTKRIWTEISQSSRAPPSAPRHVPFSLWAVLAGKAFPPPLGVDCLSYLTLIANFSAQQKKPTLPYLLPSGSHC